MTSRGFGPAPRPERLCRLDRRPRVKHARMRRMRGPAEGLHQAKNGGSGPAGLIRMEQARLKGISKIPLTGLWPSCIVQVECLK